MLARFLRLSAALPCALALVGTVAALPAAAAGTGTVSGTVLGPDSAPVEGVCVSAQRAGFSGVVARTTTASDGSYRLLDVPAGNTQVIYDPCEVAAVAPQYYRGQLRVENALAVAVPDGGEVTGIDATLAPGAAITGTVTSPSGAPVAGACVAAEADNSANTYDFARRTARTAADGSYRLDGLPALGFRVLVEGCTPYPRMYAPSTGDRAAARIVTPEAGAVVSGVDVRMQDAGSLSGRLLGSDGAPLGDRCLSLFDSGRAARFVDSARTAADGRWRLPSVAGGTYRLRVEDCVTGLHLTRWYDGQQWVADPDATFALAASEQRATPELTAPAAGAVGGTLTDDTGAALTSGCAYAYADGQDPRFSPHLFEPAVEIRGNGRYRVGGLPTGRYLVSVGTCRIGDYGVVWAGGDDRHSTAKVVEVTAGQVTAQDVVRPRAATISGTLRNDLGQPSRGCATFGGYDIALAGADGTYTSRELYPRERTVGFAAACIDPAPGEGYASETSTTVTLAPGEARTGVDGVVPTGLSLSGTVVDPDGVPVPGVCVQATAPGQADRHGHTGGTGTWRLDGMEPAAWTIQFRVCGAFGPNLMPTYYPGVPALADALPVALGTAAVTGLDTTMLQGARVRGVLRGPDGEPFASACVGALTVTGSPVSSSGGVTDADGRFDLRAMPPGVYSLRADDCRHGQDLTGVPAPTYFPGTTSRFREAESVTLRQGDNADASFRLLPGGEMRGTITDTAGKPVAGCVYLRSEEPYQRTARAGADGRYAVRGLGSTDGAEAIFSDCGVGTYASVTVPRLTTRTGRVQEQPAVALPLAASIAGVVRRDVTGEPVQDVCVQTRAADGTESFERTRADGSYRLRALAPGSYLVRFTDCSSRAFVVDEYWRDAVAPDLATAVTVAEGEDRTGIDPQLLTVTVPGIPRDARTTVARGVASVNWQPPSFDGHAPITGYVIRDAATETVLGRVDAGARSFRLSGSPAVTVEAVNRRGAGARTSVVEVPSSSTSPAPAAPPPTSAPSAAPPAVPAGADVVPLPPARVLDTRDGTGGLSGRLVPGRPVDLRVTGRGGLPPGAEVRAVLLSTTATGASAPGHLTVFPGGQDAPLASNLNYARGQTVANLVLVPVGPDGTVRLLSNAGAPHVVADVVGFVSASSPSALEPLRPARVLDTRNGTGGVLGRLAPGAAASLPVLGRGGIPATGVRAVLLNTTATGASAAGHLTVFPGGTAAPLASSLNHARGATVANLVLVPVGPDGTVRLLSSAGSPHVVADVVGYVVESSTAALRPLPPARILDTRTGTGVTGRLAPGRPTVVPVTGRGGVPLTGVRAVLLNTTVTGATRAGHLTVYPGDAAVPLASSLNHAAGQTVANLVLVPVAPDGTIRLLSNAGEPHAIADVVGWVAR